MTTLPNATCRICSKDLGFPLDAGQNHYCSITCYEGGRDALAGTLSVIRDDTCVDRLPTPEEAKETAYVVLDHKTSSYVQAAADLSRYVLALEADQIALVAWLRGRADACRRTHRAHLDAGRLDVASQALVRAEAYEVALDELTRRHG